MMNLRSRRNRKSLNTFFAQKRRGTQLKRYQGTGIPNVRISEPTPKREHLTYHLVRFKNYQFLITRFKANASNIL